MPVRMRSECKREDREGGTKDAKERTVPVFFAIFAIFAIFESFVFASRANRIRIRGGAKLAPAWAIVRYCGAWTSFPRSMNCQIDSNCFPASPS